MHTTSPFRLSAHLFKHLPCASRDPGPLFDLRKVVDAHEGPKVAVTEFAAMKGGETLQAAIAEAAFMCALERNCNKVCMLFRHCDSTHATGKLALDCVYHTRWFLGQFADD